jgi:regulation of enolase protein 1 (concanavalin A-like superfamily)
MNSTFRILGIALLFFGTGTSAFPGAKERVVFAGGFRAPLDSGWSWLREEPKGWKVEGGSLHILALPGHLFANYNNARNVLLRKAPETSKPLAVEVFVESKPKLQFEEATLYWYYDDDNFIGLFRENVGKEVQVRMLREHGGKADWILFGKKYEAEGVWFRMEVSDGKAIGYYRQTAKEKWQKMGQGNLPGKSEAKIGLNATGGSKDTDRWAQFREFRILEQAE